MPASLDRRPDLGRERKRNGWSSRWDRLTPLLPFLLAAIVPGATNCARADEPKPAKENAAPTRQRVPWTTSKLVGRPDPPPPYTVARAFPNLTFKNPVYIIQEPGSERFLVAELAGKIWAFTRDTPNNEACELFLDTPRRQIYSFSFHPRYEENGEIFVFSPRDNADPDAGDRPPEPVAENERMLSRVSRFRASAAGPRRCVGAAEQILVEWPAGGHNGGEAIIGPDGYLYISTGDSTSGSDVKNTGQGIDDLLSVIMRLDVDHPSGDRPYSIPADNPFVTYPRARPEIWAFGFRNPWRMSFDERGRLWVGDVGQDLWEMIWLVQRGGNYGWSVQEGSHPFHPTKSTGPGPILPPVVEHHHTECRSITGGYVYRGEKFPELADVYFYGDYEYGRVWGVRHDGEQPTPSRELADTSLRIASFGVSRDGEIYLVDHPSGEIHQLERSPPQSANAAFPRALSATGLFESTARHHVAAGVLPYAVNAPQWLDDATKERFVALPGTTQVKFVERSSDAVTWAFEDGAVLLETISLELRRGDPGSRRRIESRILVKQENHWLGYSYLWNEQQTDAELVEANGTDFTLRVATAASPAAHEELAWHVPSRSECMVCHSRAAGFVLGVNTIQMNRSHDYGGRQENQLRAWEELGLFSTKLQRSPEQYDSLPDPHDASAEPGDRARAFLHVNCSVCHVTDGGGNAKMVLRYHTPLKETKLFDETPIHGTFGLTGGRVLASGDPFSSVLLYRLAKVGTGRMPHVGGSTADERALDLLHDWVLGQGTPQQRGQVEGEYARLRDSLTTASETELLVAIDLALSTTRGALMLARVVAKEQLPAATRTAIIQRGTARDDMTVRDLFERFVPPSQRTQRLGDAIDADALLAMPGSAQRGRQFFLESSGTQCRHCHLVPGNKGRGLGPDLGDVGKRLKRAEILESLTHPSRKVEAKFATYRLVTDSGQVYIGLLAEKTKAEVVLNVLEGNEPKLVRVATDDVVELTQQPLSMMPERLLRDMTPQQAADLLAFLSSLRGE